MVPTIDREPPQGTPVGVLLREWRSVRGLSQLDLALRAGFSSRHLSFIETGRTQPSRQALMVLAETLDVPLRDRNRLLEAGATRPSIGTRRSTPRKCATCAPCCRSSSSGTNPTARSCSIG